MQVPETLIGTAMAIAILPTLSELFARGEHEAFSGTVNRALRSLLALTIPAAMLLAVAIRPLVQAFLGFDEAGTELVVWATRAYLVGLAGHSMLEVASRSFYAQQDARTPLWAAALNALASLLFAVTFSRFLGVVGIAAANTLAFTGEALLLLFLLSRRFNGVLSLGKTFTRVILAASAGALIVYLLMHFVPLPLLPLSVGALALGALAILPFAWPEVKGLVRM